MELKQLTMPCRVSLIAMAVLSFAGLFGLSSAGVSVIIGVVMFFVDKAMRKQPDAGSGLDIRAVPSDLKNARVWLWILLPVLMNAVSISLAKLVLPEFIDHVRARTEAFVSLDRMLLMILQLVILAVGEEIAWRAFFQKQMQRVMPFLPVLLASSVLFALGHITRGKPIVVVYDVLFVFINSLIYGVVFQKTGNAWISAISHLIANLAAIAMMGWI